MGYEAQFLSMVEALNKCPAVVVQSAQIRLVEGEIDEEYFEDVEDDVGFALDEGMTSFFGEIATAQLSWSEAPSHPHHTARGGRVNIGDLWLTISPSGFDETSVELTSPIDDAQRTHLLQLRHLELRDGGLWSAIAPDDSGEAQLWCRVTLDRTPLDVPLALDFSQYIQTMLDLAGVELWWLLHLDLDGVTAEQKTYLRDHLVVTLTKNLAALSKVPQFTLAADAAALRLKTMYS